MSNNDFGGIRAVLFDLDETLIDAQSGLEAAHETVVEKLCEYFSCGENGPTRKELSKKLTDFDDRMNRKRQYDRNTWWQDLFREVGFDVELSQDEVEELTRFYWEAYAEAAVPYPPVKFVLKYLSDEDYSLGVLTDMDGSGISKRERIQPLNFSDLFEVIVVGGEDTPQPKPDSEPFKLAASKLGVEPNECVMVGDKPFTDIKGANSVGMKTILVRRRDWGSDEEPDYAIDSLDELLDLL